ncbi:MAG TPA: alcohol dehydrogenase catalytic domain-containing protein [Acidimicrobiales bacterium]
MTVRVARLDFADRGFPVSIHDVERPALPGPGWARVAVTTAGLCGSDLHLFKATTGPTPMFSAFVAMPMEIGHEIAGVVVEAGPACGVAEGTRVAVDPTIGCEARGIDPPCNHCGAGEVSVCSNIGSGVLTPGMGLGFTNGLGGGWGDEVLAHASMLHLLPDAVSDRGASLHEPLSIAVHGLLRSPPRDEGPILVIGAGIIGLAAVAAARHLFPRSPVVVAARYRHQAAAARQLGATAVVDASGDEAAFADQLAEHAGAKVLPTAAGPVLDDGFPYVVEAVGAGETVTQALRYAGGRATVLLLGAAGISKVDLTPVFFKEIALVGSFCHAADPGPGGAATGHSVDRAVEILAAGGFPDDLLVTHEFPLADLRTAVETAIDRAAGAIKVVLRPGEG